MASTIQAAALSNVGKVRRNNQDSGYSGRSLFVVADGMGGHAGGDIASAMTVKHLVRLDHDFSTADEATEEMQRTISAANSVLTETVYEHPELTGMGTTVSAIIKVGDSMALAHIGDSRVYLYRDGEISQITADHTFVQRLVDSGRITQEEAAVHPRRSVLMRVLGDVDSAPEVDLSVLATRPGDRWVLCSDGLTGVVSNAKIALALSRTATPQAAAETLVKESLEGGAPDNVTVLVVDVIAETDQEPPTPVLVGSAEAPLEFTGALPQRAKRSSLKFTKPASVEPSHFESASENYLDELIDEDNRRRRRRRITWLVGILALVAGLAFATFLAYQWTQTRFFVGTDGTHVVIYRGIQQDLGPITLHQEEFVSQTLLEELSPDMRSRVEHTITAQDLRDAETIVKRLDESTE